jgi:hypothetical protein
MSFQNLIDANLVVANVIPQVKEFIITFPSTGYYPSEITWNIKRSDGTAVINGTPTTNIGTQNVSSTELTYDGSYVLNMFDSYGTWNGYAIAVSSTDASGNTYTRVTDNTGPASGGTLPTSASVNLNEFTITPKTEVVRADLQSMIALGHTIPELVAGNIYTNQLIKDEFSGADVLELATSSYGSLGIEDLQNLGYTNSELTGYFELWIQLGGDINGEAFEDYSGYSVSLSSDGTIVAIGAIGNDGTASNAGHVRVYQYSSGSWTQLGADIDGEANGDYSGYSVSLSSDGTIVAIGARYNDGTASNAGHVRVYQYSSGSWTQLGADIDGEASNDYSGYSVSLSSDGTIVAIGAPYNDGTADKSGHVRVYQYSSGSWTQLGADIDGEANGDQSGYSVSLNSDGTIVAIGAPYNGGTASNAGHVRVYQYSSGSWTQLGADIDGEASWDQSGYSVSLNSDGTIVAIGARYNDGTASNAGHVRVYQYSSGSWTQLGADIDGEAYVDFSGYSVSLSSDGTIVAIGAIGNDGTNTEDINDNRGHVRVYQYSSDSWTQLSVDIDGDGGGDGGGDQSGKSVSLSSDGTNVAIGSIYNDGTANAAGHVRVYNLNTPATPVAICFPAGTPVTTDQGNIPIEKLKSHIHTIRGKSIVAITKTKLLQKYIVSIKKEALSKNVPLQTTHISRSHKIFFKGCMIKAEELVDVCENVHFIPYNGETLYNVLLEKEGKMMINNLICETLSPNNIVAVISRISDKTEKNRNIRKLTSIIMKNDKEEYKKLYLSLLRSSSNTKFNKAH